VTFDSSTVFDALHNFQANYPARVKQIHVYNAGTIMDLLMTVVKFCMTEKMQQRVCKPKQLVLYSFLSS